MGAASLLLAAVLCAAILAPAIADRSRLYTSDYYQQEGFELRIDNGGNEKVELKFQADCNLVLYHNDQAYWATGTNNSGQPVCYLALENSGELIIYANKIVWTSLSGQGTLGNYYLQIQLDGNLVVYNEYDTAVWYSGTNWF